MKLFVTEAGSDAVRAHCKTATFTAVSLLAWVEMCSALALKQRTKQIDAAVSESALASLKQEWGRYQVLGVDVAVTLAAGELAGQFGLRAYDSVQLASAMRLHQLAGLGMAFCCFDKTLNRAAATLGIPLLQT